MDSVHHRDMDGLPLKHPEVAKDFNDLTSLQKTSRVFSANPIDQAHKQNHAQIKGNGGAVDLANNQSALQGWMVAGSEIAEKFHDEQHRLERNGRKRKGKGGGGGGGRCK